MVLVDGDRHGKGYVTPIVVNANESLYLPIRRFFVITWMVLVDGDRHGKGYVTPIVVNANESLYLPIRSFFVKVNTPLPTFCRD